MLVYGPFEIEEEELIVRRAGVVVPVQRQVLATLIHLMRRAGRLVSREELIAGPWGGAAVSDAAIHRAIMLARRVLQAGDAPAPIETVRGSGFRFTGEVKVLEEGMDGSAAGASESTVPAAGLANTEPLVERERELAALGAALSRARAGHGALVLVTGVAGIGKSVLVERFAAEVERAGAKTAKGWTWESGGAPALWPWIEAVRSVLAWRPSASPHADDGLASEIAALVGLAGGAAKEVENALQTRFQFFDLITRFLIETARQTTPLVVVIEDLHAADETTLLLFEFMQARIAGEPLLVVGTSRVSGSPSPSLRRLLESPASNVERVLLGELSDEGVNEMVRRLGGGELPDDELAAIRSLSEGNPLLVRQLVLSGEPLAARGMHLGTGLGKIPDRIANEVRVRVRGLSDEGQRLLEVAAVIGKEFS
ncbi:MAG TPA: AAA family ATPase, partial [Polyangiaceae bacterium]|nr:AAA family ATPase [Polyangiaceae bacterium]